MKNSLDCLRYNDYAEGAQAMQRQVIQSGFQFLISFVANLTTLATTTNKLPSEFDIYLSALIALGATLAIFTASKVKTRTQK